jgi:hypothetical protein
MSSIYIAIIIVPVFSKNVLVSYSFPLVSHNRLANSISQLRIILNKYVSLFPSVTFCYVQYAN